MPGIKRKIDGAVVDDLRTKPDDLESQKVAEGESTRQFTKLQDQDLQAKKTQEYREKLAEKREKEADKGAKAWAKVAEALGTMNRGNYSRNQMGPEDAVFEMLHLYMAFGDALVHTSFLDIDSLALLPEAIRPRFETREQWKEKSDKFSEGFSDFKKNTLGMTAYAVGAAATGGGLVAVDTIYLHRHGKHFWENNPNTPKFRYQVDFDANGELTTSLTKNGQPLKQPNPNDPDVQKDQQYERMYNAALVGWLHSRGYDWKATNPVPAGPDEPRGFFKNAADETLDMARFKELDNTGQSLEDFIEDKLKVQISEEAAPPAPRVT